MLSSHCQQLPLAGVQSYAGLGPGACWVCTLGPPPHISIYGTSSQAYLVKKGMLSGGAVQMIGDVMNENAGYYKSLLESLRNANIFSKSDE